MPGAASSRGRMTQVNVLQMFMTDEGSEVGCGSRTRVGWSKECAQHAWEVRWVTGPRHALTFACADASTGAGRAIAGRSSSRGRKPRERWCLRATGAGVDAGGFAKPAGRRPAMTKPIPRRNFHWRAGRTAGGSERRPSDEGRAAGGGDAATTPQAAHQTKELHKTSPHGCGDGTTTPRPPPRVFAHLPSQSQRICTTLQQESGAGSHGALHAPYES